MDGDSHIINFVKSLPEFSNPFELPCRMVVLTAEFSVSLVIKDKCGANRQPCCYLLEGGLFYVTNALT